MNNKQALQNENMKPRLQEGSEWIVTSLQMESIFEKSIWL